MRGKKKGSKKKEGLRVPTEAPHSAGNCVPVKVDKSKKRERSSILVANLILPDCSIDRSQAKHISMQDRFQLRM